MTRYMHEYLTFDAENVGWAIWDYLKLGMPDYKGGIYTAFCTQCYKNKQNDKMLYKLEFEEAAASNYGLPCFWAEVSGGRVSILMTGKEASRLPQAFWFKLKGLTEDWQLSKLDRWIKPEDIVGSPLISAADGGVKNVDTAVYPLDSVLVALYGRNLLRYNIKNPKQDMYFNLYNNIWNTNFPMWYSDDTLFRNSSMTALDMPSLREWRRSKPTRMR